VFDLLFRFPRTLDTDEAAVCVTDDANADLCGFVDRCLVAFGFYECSDLYEIVTGSFRLTDRFASFLRSVYNEIISLLAARQMRRGAEDRRSDDLVLCCTCP
jgi:hypothetical protein